MIKTIYLIPFLFCLACSGGEDTPPITEPLPSIPDSPENPTFKSIEDKSIEEEGELSFSLEATSPDNIPISYKIDNPPDGITLNEETGRFSWRPSLMQSGIYNLTFRAITRGGLDIVSIKVFVMDKIIPLPSPVSTIDFDNTTFLEGEIKYKLFRITISGDKEIDYIDLEGFNSAFTVIENMGGESVEIDTLNKDSRIVFADSLEESSFYTELQGAVNEAGVYEIVFDVLYKDSTRERITKEITINSSNLPIFRYDIINSMEAGLISVPRSKVLTQIQYTKNIYGSAVTPIFSGYREREIICSGEVVINAINSDSLKACLNEVVSPTSETIIAFKSYKVNGTAVGGVSFGTREAMAITYNLHNHTVAHELGHNFGLTHTFETYGAGNKHHQGSNWGLFDNSGFRRLVYSLDEDLSPVLQYGDGIDDTHLDPLGSYLATNLYGGGGIFSSFNGRFEGEDHLLFDSVQGVSDMLMDSNYICKQVYSPENRVYNFDCGGYENLFDDSIILNTMSYWLKLSEGVHLTPGQLSKVLEVLEDYPEIR